MQYLMQYLGAYAVYLGANRYILIVGSNRLV